MSTSPLNKSQSSQAERASRLEVAYAETLRSGNAESLGAQERPKVEPRPANQHQPDAGENSPLMVMTQGMRPEEMGPKEVGPKGGRQRSKRFWIILTLICIIVSGVAIGVGVGVGLNKGGSNHEGSQTSSSFASPTSSPTSSPSPTASLTILSAVYGREDVTEEANSILRQGDDIVINADVFPFSDNWVNHAKCLSLLHRNGNNNQTDIRTFVGCEGTGKYTLRPGDISLSDNAQTIPNFEPTTSTFRILSVIWHSQEIRRQSVYQTLYNIANANQDVVFNNELFEIDPLFGSAKAAAIYYTADGFVTIKNMHGIEGERENFRFL